MVTRSTWAGSNLDWGSDMGFSVSGSYALIAIGTLVAVGMAFTAGSNAIEQVSDAEQRFQDDRLHTRNTAVEFGTVSYNVSGGDRLVIEVNNTGATGLKLSAVDILIDNDLRTSFDTSSIDGDEATDIWLPGETLRLEVGLSSRPDRVKVVTGPGVAIATGVE